jgi:uncharacterized protein YegP (UPF0339 family)
MLKFIVKKAKDGQFYFTINARNHRIIATSETYTRRTSANKAVYAIAKLMLPNTYKIIQK